MCFPVFELKTTNFDLVTTKNGSKIGSKFENSLFNFKPVERANDEDFRELLLEVLALFILEIWPKQCQNHDFALYKTLYKFLIFDGILVDHFNFDVFGQETPRIDR